eukprot:gnl/Carplike_NY0171/2693_a3617_462.p1 GENE.gnl/Carplike_NY0171/2693_a3617_462~~gnl/Carplike_NY0171/2693_a3617_462.p1  ORF type:complete len:428 (-),score=165.19 gnl/Carplike_NY0171/2693_a3617_462:35-1222(-)
MPAESVPSSLFSSSGPSLFGTSDKDDATAALFGPSSGSTNALFGSTETKEPEESGKSLFGSFHDLEKVEEEQPHQQPDEKREEEVAVKSDKKSSLFGSQDTVKGESTSSSQPGKSLFGSLFESSASSSAPSDPSMPFGGSMFSNIKEGTNSMSLFSSLAAGDDSERKKAFGNTGFSFKSSSESAKSDTKQSEETLASSSLFGGSSPFAHTQPLSKKSLKQPTAQPKESSLKTADLASSASLFSTRTKIFSLRVMDGEKEWVERGVCVTSVVGHNAETGQRACVTSRNEMTGKIVICATVYKGLKASVSNTKRVIVILLNAIDEEVRTHGINAEIGYQKGKLESEKSEEKKSEIQKEIDTLNMKLKKQEMITFAFNFKTGEEASKFAKILREEEAK